MEIADLSGGMCQTPVVIEHTGHVVTLPGPSRRIVVQPLEAPALPEPAPLHPAGPSPEPVAPPTDPAPAVPEREPVPAP